MCVQVCVCTPEHARGNVPAVKRCIWAGLLIGIDWRHDFGLRAWCVTCHVSCVRMWYYVGGVRLLATGLIRRHHSVPLAQPVLPGERHHDE
jgi:hypothetical protein